MTLGEMLDVGIAGAPKRRLTVKVTISADDYDAVYRALADIEKEVMTRASHAVSGGVDNGWSYSVEEDVTMTHERYFEELAKWIKKNS